MRSRLLPPTARELADTSGHFQTAYIVMGNFSKVDRVDYVRTMLRLPDGGTM